MSATRVPFDVSLPFVVSASGGLPCSGKRYEYGAQFPWRELGLSESDLAALWIANQVDVVPDAPTEVTVKFPGVVSADLAEKLERRERKRRARS